MGHVRVLPAGSSEQAAGPAEAATPGSPGSGWGRPRRGGGTVLPVHAPLPQPGAGVCRMGRFPLALLRGAPAPRSHGSGLRPGAEGRRGTGRWSRSPCRGRHRLHGPASPGPAGSSCAAAGPPAPGRALGAAQQPSPRRWPTGSATIICTACGGTTICCTTPRGTTSCSACSGTTISCAAPSGTTVGCATPSGTTTSCTACSNASAAQACCTAAALPDDPGRLRRAADVPECPAWRYSSC